MKRVIYYFSGTGNSLRAARIIAAETGACIGCAVCRKVCPCKNITFSEGRPVWNHRCEGCNACVVYCPTKAIQFRTPEAYAMLDNPITRKLGLPDSRTRYHHPYVTAADLMKDCEEILPPSTAER